VSKKLAPLPAENISLNVLSRELPAIEKNGDGFDFISHMQAIDKDVQKVSPGIKTVNTIGFYNTRASYEM
jgi:hypothetical protein